MKFISEPAKRISIRDETDIIVIGAGPAGLMAAVGAARAGVDVLLVERYGFLGGNLTAANVLNIRCFNDYAGKLVIKGLPYEFVMLLREYGGTTNIPEKDPYVRHNPEITKYVAQKFVEDAGVRLLLHCFAVGTVVENFQIKAIIIESKEGREALLGKVIVDTTGDADMAAYAGVPYEKGLSKNNLPQPMTMTFIMDNVNVKTWPTVVNKGIKEIFIKKYSEGKYPVNRNDLALFPFFQYKGRVYANTTRVSGDGTKIEDMTRAELEGRTQVMKSIEFFKRHFPGFENIRLISTPAQIGIRETRRIQGKYTLTKEDVLSARDFEDSITRGSYCVDIHHPESDRTQHISLKPGTSYAIPYRCLVPLKIDNLLVAGRCLSATSEAAASARAMAICMATGQAAGVAAAICAKEGLCPKDVDIKILQKKLIEQEVII